MKKCVLGVCNGSGLIQLKNGSFVRCGCGRINKANDLFKKSSAPKSYQTFIQELDFNPFIQNMNKKELLEAKKQNCSNQEYKEQMIKTFSPLKELLLQFDDGKHQKPIRRFIEENYRLYFYGDTGTGKTQAAVSLAYEGGKRNVDFYYLSLHQIHNLFRFNYNDVFEANKVSYIKEQIEKSEILIIDDLGRELDGLNLHFESDEKLARKIYEFLDGILRSKNRFVIISSNIEKSEARKTYQELDPRLTSILFDGNVLSYHFRDKIRSKKQDDLLHDLL